MDNKFLEPYKPDQTEDSIYAAWEKDRLFTPEKAISSGLAKQDAVSFSIVLPPPNVTGVLHMGHAAMLAIEDIVVRFERMRGKRTLWIPGTDHAAIATQSKVEKLLEKEKVSKYDLGREEFLKRVERFAQESHDTIVHQIKKMGASVDWGREAYTLDENRSLAVRTAFKRMYDDGLIYRGHRIVNWDPKMQTTVSDDEIEYVEMTGPFYYLKYGPFVIGTSRPETKFGDRYVVMHPDDARYARYAHGQKVEVEWINGPVTATIIKDTAIDMSFGSGVMTITPWHDAVDFDIAERHRLDKEQIIDERGKLLPIAGEFAGMHISKARPEIVKKLEQKGLVEKIEERYVHNVATNSRGGGVIEPQIKLQWFIDVNKPITLERSNIDGIPPGSLTTLKEIMRKSVASGAIEILPDRFKKIYFQWVDNLRDWCISRQIWYGHRIPAWIPSTISIPNDPKRDNERVKVQIESPGSDWVQDPDTLDTWFSSGLWTFSTLGWPDQDSPDLKLYHPTSLLETGYDILFFWVARMILMSGYHMGEVPFRTVYLHGLVRDAKGRKMSKSLGNIIDPLEMIVKYGADATRMSLIIGTGPGSDLNLSEDKIRAYKKFSNKVWNIARFILSSTEEIDPAKRPTLSDADQRFVDEYDEIVSYVTEHISTYKLHLAAERLYHYVWHTLADIAIEERKSLLREGGDEERRSAQWSLRYVFIGSLKLLHPFMPFITEEIWKSLPEGTQPLIITPWPKT